MLADVVQNFETFLHTDTVMYGTAAVGLCAFAGLYYVGEYLFRDRAPEPDAP
jgi:hypothetical protein